MFRLSFYLSFLEWDLSETSWNNFLFLEVRGTILAHTGTSPFSLYSSMPPSMQIHHHWCHREVRTPSNIAKSGFECSYCNVASAEMGTVGAAEICNELTKIQCWGGLSHMVCCRPAFPEGWDTTTSPGNPLGVLSSCCHPNRGRECLAGQGVRLVCSGTRTPCRQLGITRWETPHRALLTS